MFAAEITNKFILGLDVLHAHDASMDSEYPVLRMCKEDVQFPAFHGT
jgi:hypothetical protein